MNRGIVESQSCIKNRHSVIDNSSTILRNVIVCCFIFGATALSPTSSDAQGGISISGMPGDPRVVSFKMPLSDEEGGEVQATFEFGTTKGFLGPSTDPSSQDGFSNTDHTLFAVNNQPMTKSSFVHFFLRSSNGDFIFLNNVNETVAQLLQGKFSDSAAGFLRVESIDGRKVHLQTVDFSGRPKGDGMHWPEYNFVVSVDDKGHISLTR